MGTTSDAAEAVSALPGRLGGFVRRHPRGATAVGSAVAAGLAMVARPLMRRGSKPPPPLPDAALLASAAAASVHNAAKGKVVMAVRAEDAPTTETVLATIRIAVANAASAGADVTSAALGGVDGAIDVAELLDRTPIDLAREAASAARDAAEDVGHAAAVRVAEALAALDQ